MIGQAPSKSGAEKPLQGRPMALMCRVFGTDRERMNAAFRFANLLEIFPGKNGKGDFFPMEKAKRSARLMMSRRGDLVLAGKLVAAAFGVPISGRRYFEWFQISGRRAVIFPHPSGINTWWNSGANRRRAKNFFRDNFLEDSKPKVK